MSANNDNSKSIKEIKDPMNEENKEEFDPEQTKAIFGNSNWKSIRAQIQDVDLDADSFTPKQKISSRRRKSKQSAITSKSGPNETTTTMASPPRRRAKKKHEAKIPTVTFEEQEDDVVNANGATEIKLDESDDEGDVPQNLPNLDSVGIGNMSAFAEKLAKQNVAIKYREEYLNKNTLEVLLEAFQMLDSTINLFFFTYSGLKRSSFICTKIWLNIMKTRLLMNDSISHLVESPHLLSPGFRESRNLHILAVRESSKVVARAVQFLVTISQHTETWKFHRNAFLVSLGEEICAAAESNATEMINFEVTMHEMTPMTRKSYKAHVELEELKIRRSLNEVQPKSDIAKNDDNYIRSLEDMIRDLKQIRGRCEDDNVLKAFEENQPFVHARARQIIENNFLKFRIQLVIVKNIQNVQRLVERMSDDEVVYEEDDSIWQSGHELLREQLNMNALEQVLIDDQKIWPHQRGVKQVGPYRVLPLRTPEVFLNIDMEHLTYSAPINGAEAMGIFAGYTGVISRPTAVTIGKTGSGKQMRNSLKIPEKAEFYSFFHPIQLDWNKAYADYGVEGVTEMVDNINAMVRDLSPIHAIAGHGAFGYFDKNYQLLQVNGLAMGEDLFFDGPYFLPSKSGFQLVADHEVKTSRVTIDNLVESDAIRHGWLATIDELNAFQKNGEEFYFPGENKAFGGAFFFEYNNGKFPQWNQEDSPIGGRRNYFQLMDFHELSLKKMKNRNTPVLRQLAYEVALKKKDWDVMKEYRAPEEVGNLKEVLENKRRRQKHKQRRCIVM